MTVSVATRTKAIIQVYVKDDRISTYELDLNEKKEITIGRALDNDVVIHPLLSLPDTQKLKSQMVNVRFTI